MIDLAQAHARLAAEIEPLPVETVALADALGRVLARDVAADRDFPPTDRSAMDGYAVRSADAAGPRAVLRVDGEQRAGEPPRDAPLAPGTCCRIFTGAVIPPGADAVVPVESTTAVDGDDARVRIEPAVRPGDHVRRRGEELRAGALALGAGRLVRAAEIAALASVGAIRVEARRRPTVAVLATGDEIVEPDREPAPHQVRNSNAWSLAALLADSGHAVRRLGIAADRPEALDRAIADGLADDVLLLTGGVSVGAYDLVAAALARAGARTVFHGVAVKPGKPVLAARAGARWIFGLPGNPVSTFACSLLFVLPALRRLAGVAEPGPHEVAVRVEEGFRCRPGRTTYHLAELSCDPERGAGWAGRRVAARGSGDVLALARANGALVTPAGRDGAEAGEILRGLPWSLNR